MDDFRIVIYVILGIIFVVSRIIKANKPSPNAPKPRRRPNKGGSPSPQSFEDVLKEFGEKMHEQTEERPAPVQESRKEPR
ncbi:MAG: hypothetical protein WBA74_20805 [Cyclobacteriaceae bacterium]